MNFERTPYFSLRILFFLIFGVLSYIYFALWNIILPYIFGGLICLYIILLISLSNTFKRKYSAFLGALGGGIIFLFGVLLVESRTGVNKSNHLFNIDKPYSFYEAVVVEDVQPKKRTKKTTVNITRIKTEKGWVLVEGKILLYISNEDSTKLNYGDKILVKGMPIEVPPPANPKEFNYKRYLSFQNIYFQQYLKKGTLIVLQNYFSEEYDFFEYKPYTNFFIAFAGKARQKCAGILKKYIDSPQEYAVAVALVLGLKDDIDNELKSAYASAGAMHVLAVSGLHVGIIIHLLVFLLGKLKTSRKGKWIYAFCVIIGIWTFAFITGLSASVMRAVVMYTIFIIGKTSNKHTSIYNILAVTAIILLLYKPYIIMEVGFQLSFAAVIGIVYLQPKIYILIVGFPKLEVIEKTGVLNKFNKFFKYALDYVIKITAVSIAAQIATFPIGLLYFHQFPVYFWFSNLFVIILALLIVYGCIIILVCSVFPFIPYLIGGLIKWLISVLNFSVFEIQKLPIALIEGININTFETWVIYGAIISFIFLYVNKRFTYLVTSFCLTFLFITLQIIENYQQINQKSMIVYKVNNHSGFNFIDGLESIIVGDSAFINAPDKIRFHVSQNLWNKGIDNIKLLSFKDIELNKLKFAKSTKNGQILMVWNQKSILNIREPLQDYNINVDYLVVSNNAIKNLDNINKIDFKYLLVDASNSNYTSDRLRLQGESLGLNVISLKKTGAFVIDL